LPPTKNYPQRQLNIQSVKDKFFQQYDC